MIIDIVLDPRFKISCNKVNMADTYGKKSNPILINLKLDIILNFTLFYVENNREIKLFHPLYFLLSLLNFKNKKIVEKAVNVNFNVIYINKWPVYFSEETLV